MYMCTIELCGKSSKIVDHVHLAIYVANKFNSTLVSRMNEFNLVC